MIISQKKSTIVWSTIKVSWVWRCSRNDDVMHNYLNVILKFGVCILVTIISVKVIEKNIVTCLECRSFGLTYSVLTSPTIIAWKALARDCTNNNGLILQIGVLSS